MFRIKELHFIRYIYYSILEFIFYLQFPFPGFLFLSVKDTNIYRSGGLNLISVWSFLAFGSNYLYYAYYAYYIPCYFSIWVHEFCFCNLVVY